MTDPQTAIQLHWIANGIYELSKAVWSLGTCVVIAAVIRALCNK